MVTRLSGGLTPADGSDPRTFPGIWNAAADELERGFRLVDTVYFTSSGTFTKATYPWLRAIRVKVQAGGGGGGGCSTTGAGQVSIGGGAWGGNFAESFIQASDLTSSVVVDVGAGGAGGSAGNNNGSDGGTSSFGSGETFEVSASGGRLGQGDLARTGSAPANVLAPTATFAGDVQITGGEPSASVAIASGFVPRAGGGGSRFASGTGPGRLGNGANGLSGRDLGGGGGGGSNNENQATARNGGTGAAGIVIVELYA